MTLKIALSMNYQELENGRQRAYLDKEYFDYLAPYDAVVVPIVQMDEDAYADKKIDNLLDICDGIIFTGGWDINPAGTILHIGSDTDAVKLPADQCIASDIAANRYDWGVYKQECLLHPRRQAFEFRLYRRALARNMPLLAICLGIQLINVAHGGSLYGHLPDDFANEQGKDVDHGGLGIGTNHKINIEPFSKLAELLGADSAEVNSFHHQGIKKVGQGLLVTARSDDGLVEALELGNTANGGAYSDYPFFLAVQWHPERQPDSDVSQKIMAAFLLAAANNR